MKRCAIIHPDLRIFGGAEQVLLDIVNTLHDNFSITILTTTENNFTIKGRCKIRKVGLSIPIERFRKTFAVKKLYKIADEFDFIIITGGSSMPNKTKKPTILYCNNSFTSVPKNFQGFSKNVSIISNSEFTKSQLKKLFNKDSTVIYPSVELNPRLHHDKNPHVVTLTRYSPEKNLRFGFDVMNDLDITWLVVGQWKGRQYQHFLDLNNKIKKNIRITLFENIPRQSAIEFLYDSKVYFCPSIESFGIATIESMLAGCIPIVPNNSAHKETVPFNELRFDDKESAKQAIKDAVDGKFNYLKNDLLNHAKQFDNKVFRKKLVQYFKIPVVLN